MGDDQKDPFSACGSNKGLMVCFQHSQHEKPLGNCSFLHIYIYMCVHDMCAHVYVDSYLQKTVCLTVRVKAEG